MSGASVLELRLTALAIACACATLLLRPPLMAAHGSTALIVVLFGSLLVLGVSAPVVERAGESEASLNLGLVIAIGCVAFLCGRVLVDGDAIAAAVPRVLVLNTLAAVAEEAFFRRLVYGWLDRWGSSVAVVGSTVSFALVHVTVYGWWVVPIDLAAGLILSWQRWATGSWAASAVTHSFANALAVL